MFFYTQQNNRSINQPISEIQSRYNLDMTSNFRNRISNKIIKQKLIQEKKNKIKSLKMVEPINNNRWDEDIFEQIKLEEQKNKIRELKLIEPKQRDITTIENEDEMNDSIYMSDWVESNNNICV